MSLSESERRRLDEIEDALRQDDPEFVASIDAGRLPRVRAILFGLMFVAGAATLVGGLVTTHAFAITGSLIAIAGVAVMATAATYLHRELRHDLFRP